MLPPHVLTYMKQFEPCPWLIVGKGPSFDAQKVAEYHARGFRICGINNAPAAYNVPTDLAVANDTKPLVWMPPGTVPHVRAMAFPSGLHDNLPNDLAFILESARGIAAWGSKLHGFDMRNLNNYPFFPKLRVVCSSTESAIQILAHSGVREIHFIGVDGGQPHHKAFEVRQDEVDLDRQFREFRHLKLLHPDVVFYGLPERANLNGV